MEAPPPAADLLGPSIDSFATSPTLRTRFRALQLIQKHVGKQLAAAYQSKCPVLPHSFQIGDAVYKLPGAASPTGVPRRNVTATKTGIRPPGRSEYDKLFDLVTGALHALNSTNPNLTESCWLCMATSPPYYEGFAINVAYNWSSSDSPPPRCFLKPALTLSEVSGNGTGTCVGNPPNSHRHLCATTNATKPGSNQYLILPDGLWWACARELTPCVSTHVLDQTNDFCVAVQVLPKVRYHPPGEIEDRLDPALTRHRREVVTAVTVGVLLTVGMAAGVGTGTTALIQGNAGLAALQKAVDQDIRDLQQSVLDLQESLTSLSEVALQNRRGLDLLFMKEGGLCAALGEECCFYVDHSGVVKDTMKKLEERLNQRRRERDAAQSWFEGWYSKSPWLTTLLSTIAGPLVILIIILTFGPCILNRLLQFIRDRLSITQALILTQQYQRLRTEDTTGTDYADARVP